VRNVGAKRLKRGLTIIELTVAIVVLVGIVTIAVVMLPNARVRGKQVTSTTYLRGIAHALIVWDQNSNGFPVPSALDLKITTTAEIGAAKDHSANMWSILIYNGFVPAELLVSPLEKNRNIKPFTRYAMTAPAAAVDPANALWDPAFSADFTKGNGGVSYANLPHTPARRAYWKRGTLFSSMSQVDEIVPLIADRGPKVTGVAPGGNGGMGVTLENPRSNALGRRGTKGTWEGGVAFNDMNVETFKGIENGWCAPSRQQRCTYTDASGQVRIDIPFFDEPDDPSRTNTYLGIFTTAGEKESDFTAIWD
jgi:type II secretory pathway pseudopilin PulG